MCAVLNFTSADPDAPLCHLAPVATWADRVRFKMRWSAPLHYVGALGDHPSETCLFPGSRGWAGRRGQNVLAAVQNVTGILEDWVGVRRAAAVGEGDEGDERTNEALKFLVHFLGDMHMPVCSFSSSYDGDRADQCSSPAALDRKRPRRELCQGLVRQTSHKYVVPNPRSFHILTLSSTLL